MKRAVQCNACLNLPWKIFESALTGSKNSCRAGSQVWVPAARLLLFASALPVAVCRFECVLSRERRAFPWTVLAYAAYSAQRDGSGESRLTITRALSCIILHGYFELSPWVNRIVVDRTTAKCER